MFEVLICIGMVLGNAVLNLFILGEFLKFILKRRTWIASLCLIAFSLVVGACWQGNLALIGIVLFGLYLGLPVIRCVMFLKNEDYKTEGRTNYVYGAILLLFAIPCAYFLLMGLLGWFMFPRL